MPSDRNAGTYSYTNARAREAKSDDFSRKKHIGAPDKAPLPRCARHKNAEVIKRDTNRSFIHIVSAHIRPECSGARGVHIVIRSAPLRRRLYNFPMYYRARASLKRPRYRILNIKLFARALIAANISFVRNKVYDSAFFPPCPIRFFIDIIHGWTINHRLPKMKFVKLICKFPESIIRHILRMPLVRPRCFV